MMKTQARTPRGAAGHLRLLGVRVDDVTEAEALDRIETFIQDGTPHQVVTVNPEFVVMAQQDRIFMDILNSADLCLPDGVGLLWAARTLGRPLRERVAGSDLVYRLAQLAEDRGHSVYLLGAGQGIGQKAAERLIRQHPGLRVVGAYPGSPRPEEDAGIVARIRAVSPQILLVAFGAPAQDRWIRRNMELLGVPVSIGVGGALDFVSGKVRRAPVWMRKLGVEWLFRLAMEPWRWRRMIRLPRFAIMVLRQRIWQSA
ncbi:MAG: WecB/TagA/CpsF family glycosyltransferase [Dehalococcoidia bacterium]|nr:WecB/TagA/CpsF family glycosyltransferase [Dehalococcoidia bacterium]